MTGSRMRRVQTGHRRAWILPDTTAPTAALAATLLALILVGTVAGMVLRPAGPTGLVDQPTETFLVTHRTAWLTDAMRLVTDLGAAEVLVPLVLVAGLGWRWRRGNWWPLALLSGAAAGAWAVQVAVKQLVERPARRLGWRCRTPPGSPSHPAMPPTPPPSTACSPCCSPDPAGGRPARLPYWPPSAWSPWSGCRDCTSVSTG
jgi:hypothetical protein